MYIAVNASAMATAKRRRVGDVFNSRLADVLHTGGISTVGLARLISALDGDGGRATETARRALARENNRLLDELRCEIELPQRSGGTFRWVFLDPAKLLARSLAESPGLQDLFADALARKPNSPLTPWRVVIGFDEFTPGNKLSTDQSRKAMVCSFSFLELGGAALSLGSTWCVPIVVRSAKLADVPWQAHGTCG